MQQQKLKTSMKKSVTKGHFTKLVNSVVYRLLKIVAWKCQRRLRKFSGFFNP